jgi:phenylacetate-CoA ligase
MEKLQKMINQIILNYYTFQLRRNQWKDLKELRKIQFKKIKTIIKHAYNHVPYYHRIFSFAGIKPDDIKTFEDLRKIPLVSKRDIQKNYQDFITKGVDTSKLPSRMTSGSTGIPLKLISDPYPSSGSSKYPFFECGVRLRDNFVTVWGRGAKNVRWGAKYTWLLGEISETVVPLFPEEKLIKILRKIKPDVLSTFPSLLLTLANHDTSGINPRLIFTQGETVTQHCRDVCLKRFNVNPFETYGCVEFGTLAFECPQHFGLHILTDNVYVEFIDENREQVSPGERGEIVVTGLHYYVMPLIRYRIGDLGVPIDEQCQCGRSWPIIKSVEGRINDYLVLSNGRKISYLYIVRHSDPELKKNPFCISQYQIVQELKNKIIFKAVKGKKFDYETLERIKCRLEAAFARQGENLEVIIQLVDEIPMGKTGKRRIFISKLN